MGLFQYHLSATAKKICPLPKQLHWQKFDLYSILNDFLCWVMVKMSQISYGNRNEWVIPFKVMITHLKEYMTHQLIEIWVGVDWKRPHSIFKLLERIASLLETSWKIRGIGVNADIPHIGWFCKHSQWAFDTWNTWSIPYEKLGGLPSSLTSLKPHVANFFSELFSKWQK